VLCLDNLNYWFSQEEGSQGFTVPFLDEFHDIFNDVGTQLRVIAAGSSLPREAFDPLDSYVRLGPIDADDARRLIRDPITDAYVIEDDALDQLLVYSDRLPGQLQRLARYAVQAMLDEDARAVTNKHADRAVDRALEDFEPAFRQLWHGGATPPYRLIAPLTETEKTALLNALNYKGVVALLTTPATRFGGAVFTEDDGNLRLTRLFTLWLRNVVKA
jgi:hypothetical protein